MNGERTEIINGIPVYLQTDPHLHQFCIGLYIRAGSMYESPVQNGITHLLEHMVFRNVKQKYHGRLYELLSENGVWFNGSTYKEFLCFTVSGLPRGIRFGVDVLLSVLDLLEISPRDFAAEKKRVLAEIREDDDLHTLRDFTDRRVWRDTSLAQSVSGTATGVKKITLRQVQAWQRHLLDESAYFFCVTGNTGEAGENDLFSGLSTLRSPRKMPQWLNTAPTPAAFGCRSFRLNVQNAEWCRVSFSFDVSARECPKEILHLIYLLLFCNDDALLYTALSENAGLIYSYDSRSEQYANISALKFSFEVNEADVPEAIRRTFAVLDSVKNGDFSLGRTVSKGIAALEADRDNAEAHNWNIAYDNHILGGKQIDYSTPDLGIYTGITKEDVMRCAGRIFQPQNLVLTFKGNRTRLRSMDLQSFTDLIKN